MQNKIVALAGPPGAGKTTVGRILSDSLGADFADTDQMIANTCQHSIPWIFEHNGESFFRNIERNTIINLLNSVKKPTVISLGGGALLDETTRTAVEKKTILFVLLASAETLLARNNGGRPLAENPSQLIRLLENRKKHYLSTGRPIQTDNKTPDEIAEVIRREVHLLWFPQGRLF